MIENNSIKIVQTNMKYNYSVLKEDINKLKIKYPFLEIGQIGYSVLGKKIPYIKIGKGKKEILYQGAIHANEWITSVVLMQFIEEFCRSYTLNANIYGYQVQEIFNEISLYIVPMVNPDGVDLVTENVYKNSKIYKNYVALSRVYPDVPFPNGWKANFNGKSLTNFQHKCCVNRISL